MRLNEIISPRVKTVSPRAPHSLKRTLGHQISNNTLTHLGSGRLGSAYQHKNRPGTIIKVGRVTDTIKTDGYLQFLLAIFKGDRMMSNPYFPRVYDLKIFDRTKEDRLSDIEYVAEIERLDTMDSLSIQELNAIGEKMFHDWQQVKDDDSTADIASELANLIARQIQGMILRQQDYLATAKDKHLIQAVAVISNISKRAWKVRQKSQHGVQADVIPSNLMVRRTSVGPQLVITDPLG